MQSLSRIPKVLDTIDGMRECHDMEKVFSQYKQNVQIFIDAMKEQVAALIDNYQRTIQELKQEITSLKDANGRNQFVRTPQHSRYCSTPTTPKQKQLMDMLQSTVSNSGIPLKSSKLDRLPISSILKKRSLEESEFPDCLISPPSCSWQQNTSKFQIVSRQKKQKQAQLRLFLESGKKSMNETTQQFFEVVGKNKKADIMNEEESSIQKEQSKSILRKGESSNASLSQICQNLDTSFVSRQARSRKKKKQAKAMEQMKQKQRIQAQTEKMLKDRGIKSLLQRLRHNVECSVNDKQEPIRSSRLIMCNDSKQIKEPMSPSKKGKVMINPVPIDAKKRGAVQSRERQKSPSPQRKPQSILKKSSTVLSRSILMFSEI